MRWLGMLCLGLALLGPVQALAVDQAEPGRTPVTSKRMTLEQTVGSEVFQKAGLAKLTPEEQFELAAWIRDYTKQIADYVEAQCRRDAGQAAPKP